MVPTSYKYTTSRPTLTWCPPLIGAQLEDPDLGRRPDQTAAGSPTETTPAPLKTRQKHSLNQTVFYIKKMHNLQILLRTSPQELLIIRISLNVFMPLEGTAG